MLFFLQMAVMFLELACRIGRRNERNGFLCFYCPLFHFQFPLIEMYSGTSNIPLFLLTLSADYQFPYLYIIGLILFFFQILPRCCFTARVENGQCFGSRKFSSTVRCRTKFKSDRADTRFKELGHMWSCHQEIKDFKFHDWFRPTFLRWTREFHRQHQDHFLQWRSWKVNSYLA